MFTLANEHDRRHLSEYTFKKFEPNVAQVKKRNQNQAL